MSKGSNKRGRMDIDKKEYMRENMHLTRPPRMEGAVQRARLKSKKK